MNHYEELGVSPSATTAEIRQAYKSLVRVLHPDQQQDLDMRRLSELQLRRLNHLYQVLSDPEQRRIYDLGLQQYLPALRHNGSPHDMRQEVAWSDISRVRLRLRIKPGAVVWILIGMIALGSAIFWIRWPEPAQPSRQAREQSQTVDLAATPATGSNGTPVRTVTARPASPASEPAQKREPAYESSRQDRKGHTVLSVPERSTAGPVQAAALRTPQNENPLPAATRPRTESPEVAAIVPTVPAVAPKNADPPPPPILKAQSVSVSGKWLYVPRTEDGKTSLYPPEYIELRINNRAGFLRGKYYGKYRVSDRAISSEINFQFEGRQGDAVSILPWTGNNGSKGEMRLKRLTNESIEVNWITTTFGQTNTLASGTAVLYRSDPP
ncbi:MAG: DnaJ domain-containing protein [Acidobacteriota bacterium]|nr:DnaJ domain-containing protein [Acidobacteriota bacterium]